MHKNSKATALLLALAIIVLIAILSGIVIGFSLNSSSLTSRVINGTRAFYFAEAGIKRAMYKIKNNDLSSPENWTFSGQAVDITITSSAPNTYIVTSSATYGASNVNKNIQATITKSNTVQLTEWKTLN